MLLFGWRGLAGLAGTSSKPKFLPGPTITPAPSDGSSRIACQRGQSTEIAVAGQPPEFARQAGTEDPSRKEA